MNDWTDVRDRLPKGTASVLVRLSERGALGQHCVAWYSPDEWNTGDRWGIRLEGVTHWTELPPKPESRYYVEIGHSQSRFRTLVVDRRSTSSLFVASFEHEADAHDYVNRKNEATNERLD